MVMRRTARNGALCTREPAAPTQEELDEGLARGLAALTYMLGASLSARPCSWAESGQAAALNPSIEQDQCERTDIEGSDSLPPSRPRRLHAPTPRGAPRTDPEDPARPRRSARLPSGHPAGPRRDSPCRSGSHLLRV